MTGESNTKPRNILAMKWGDNCWLKELTSAPELNGKQVRLDKWFDDRQRWRCSPVGWSYHEDFLAVKPKNLSANPPEPKNKNPTSSSSGPVSWSSMSGTQLAASLEMLMKREDKLRSEAIRLFNEKDTSRASLESSIRLGMCQIDVLEVQLEILTRGGSRDQVKQAKSNLDKIHNANAVHMKQWKLAGYEAVNYWEPPMYADEVFLKKDVENYRKALGPQYH